MNVVVKAASKIPKISCQRLNKIYRCLIVLKVEMPCIMPNFNKGNKMFAGGNFARGRYTVLPLLKPNCYDRAAQNSGDRMEVKIKALNFRLRPCIVS
jgi:hypothetical protein